MDTMILISGGWRSAYALIRWLRTHGGKCVVLFVKTSSPRDNDRIRAVAALRQYVEANYPDRVDWRDALIGTTLPGYALPHAEVMHLVVSNALKVPQYSGIKTVMGAGDWLKGAIKAAGSKAEIVPTSGAIVDALVEIAPALFRALCTCEAGPLPCGTCPACAEIENARKQIAGGVT
jgi:hypothetical protein